MIFSTLTAALHFIARQTERFHRLLDLIGFSKNVCVRPIADTSAANELLGSFRPGELCLLASPSLAKSALAQQTAIEGANRGLGVAVFCLEHGTRARQWHPSIRVSEQRTLAAITERSKALHSRHKLDLIVINNLGLIADCWPVSGETAEQATGRVAGTLKRLAVELNVTLLLVAQTNRVVWKDRHREPALSDLWVSVVQSADRIFFLCRPNAAQGKSDAVEGAALSSIPARLIESTPTGRKSTPAHFGDAVAVR